VQNGESGPFQPGPRPLFRSRDAAKEGLTMKNRNSAVWMAVVAVVALVLASLTIASQGPLPHVHAYQVHIAPGWA
jgi:hypothetical protein